MSTTNNADVHIKMEAEEDPQQEPHPQLDPDETRPSGARIRTLTEKGEELYISTTTKYLDQLSQVQCTVEDLMLRYYKGGAAAESDSEYKKALEKNLFLFKVFRSVFRVFE